MILTINPGSSSLKFKLFGTELIEGKIESIGKKTGQATIVTNGKALTTKKYFPNHEYAINYMLKIISETISIQTISKVAYRVVHGGPITKPSLINKKVLQTIEEYSEIAPLHNIPALRTIKFMQQLLPIAKHIAFFDTSFHTTIPEFVRTYPIPKALSKKYKIIKYGFHGISHEYLSTEVTEKKIITCHLGNGSSITAIKNGKSIDTTMGFSPLDGLLMGTRPGDLDPEIILYLMNKEKLSTKEMENILNTKSGLFGLTGTNDLRIIHKKAIRGNKECKLAIEMLAYSAAKYINAFNGILHGTQAIIFSAGIGEEAPYLRKKILEYVPDIKLDNYANNNNQRVIGEGKIKIYVIPANEEKLMYVKSLRF